MPVANAAGPRFSRADATRARATVEPLTSPPCPRNHPIPPVVSSPYWPKLACDSRPQTQAAPAVLDVHGWPSAARAHLYEPPAHPRSGAFSSASPAALYGTRARTHAGAWALSAPSGTRHDTPYIAELSSHPRASRNRDCRPVLGRHPGTQLTGGALVWAPTPPPRGPSRAGGGTPLGRAITSHLGGHNPLLSEESAAALRCLRHVGSPGAPPEQWRCHAVALFFPRNANHSVFMR